MQVLRIDHKTEHVSHLVLRNVAKRIHNRGGLVANTPRKSYMRSRCDFEAWKSANLVRHLADSLRRVQQTVLTRCSGSAGGVMTVSPF
jgi:hypothetical protein